jgi:pimeloyl-ACP methyl ester carboxylesterase
MRPSPITLLVAALVSLVPGAGCYTAENADMFPIARAALDAARLAALATSEQRVERIAIDVPGRTIDAYRVHLVAPAVPRGTIVFFGGNGNEIEPVIKVVLPQLRRLGLDFVVMSYWREGEPRPTVASTRSAGGALIRTILEGSPGLVCVMGHSLGAWFAIDAAARPEISGAALAAVGTTPADLNRAQAGFWRHFFVSRQDASLRALDGVALAGKVVTPIAVVTSDGDEDIPPALSGQVFAALPARLPKTLVTLSGVRHGAYLRSTAFWDAAARVLCTTAP